ncbi:FecR family protein [Sunxiuqinia sp. A32]|uniref:FecR family protein n=1 Tax=Sunxiuqinia sp. A32 TaxID=3461496 RepID=UPI0040465A5F
MASMNLIDDVLLKYLQRKASPGDLEELEKWRSQNAENKRTLTDYFQIWMLSSLYKKKKPQVSFQETWEIINKRSSLTPIVRLNYKRVLQYAAIVILVLNIGWWSSNYFYSTEDHLQQIHISADQASNSIVTLPDQTVVYLRKGSSMNYDSKFLSGNRNVELVGEGYFEVTKDAKHPFIVHTENSEIKVLGTKFNVLAESGSSICQTTLIEGKVQFETSSGKKYLLKPNQQIEFNASANSIQMRDVETELFTAWKDGKVVFRNETLGAITKKLEKMYSVQFVFKTPELATDHSFTGSFHKETSIGEVIKMLKISIPMEVEREENFPEKDIIYLK